MRTPRQSQYATDATLTDQLLFFGVGENAFDHFDICQWHLESPSKREKSLGALQHHPIALPTVGAGLAVATCDRQASQWFRKQERQVG
jgi:hypothetical protein